MRSLSVIIGLSLICLSLFPSEGRAQECDDFLARLETENNIYTRENRGISKREIKRNQDAIKSEMLSALKIKMAERILTEVKTSSISSVIESDQVYEDFYNYESEISTTASLAFGKEEFCLDKKNRVLYGIYSLNRIKTAEAVVLDCENRMGKLLAEIRQANQVGRTRNLDVYKTRSEKINQDSRIADFLNTSSDQSKLIALYDEFQGEFQLMESKASENNYTDELKLAQTRIDEKEYSHAISMLKKLGIEYPNRQEVQNLISEAENRYYAQTLNRVLNLQAQEKYKEALAELDELCSIISCSDEIIETRGEIVAKYFEQEYEVFQKAVRFGLEKQATLHYQALSRMASANEKDFQKARRTYEVFQLEQKMRKVEQDLEYKNYHAAFAEIKSIQYESSVSYTPLENLRLKTEHLLLRHEIKKEKGERRKLFAVAVGVEAISNSSSDFNSTFDPQWYSLAYSIGIYKKFRYVHSYGGDYPKASDMIGLKFRLVDFWNAYRIPSGESLVPAFPYRYDSEIMIDGTIFQVIHYGVGTIFGNRDVNGSIGYCGELGLRLPIGPISIQANLRYTSQEGEGFYVLQTGLFGQFDFWRNFGAADKNAIKKKYGL